MALIVLASGLFVVEHGLALQLQHSIELALQPRQVEFAREQP